MNRFSVLLVIPLLTGCIENEIRSNVPPLGVPNARPLEPVENTDKLVQTPVPVVDILWIIDNSTSMRDDQQALMTNFPAFMGYFEGSGLDYHIGVITTDYARDEGRLRTANGVKWVDIDDEDPSVTFAALADVGTRLGTDERGRDPAYAALEIEDGPGGFNEGFERDDGSLHMVVISDENDHSQLITIDEFVSYVEASRPDPSDVTFSSIVTPPGGCFPGGAEDGVDYVEMTGRIGGILQQICIDDWTRVLEELGIQAAGLRREYFLSELPVPETLHVWVEDGNQTLEFEQDTDYVYNADRNSVLFLEYVPNAMAEVYIEYDLLSAGEGA